MRCLVAIVSFILMVQGAESSMCCQGAFDSEIISGQSCPPPNMLPYIQNLNLTNSSGPCAEGLSCQQFRCDSPMGRFYGGICANLLASWVPALAEQGFSCSATCDAPPKEQCCTRIMSDPSAELKVSVGAVSALSSITIWNDFGSGAALLNWKPQLNGLFVNIGLNDSVTGCSIGQAPPNSPLSPGFISRLLTCGTEGNVFKISFPSLVTPSTAATTRIAVKLCVIKTAVPDPLHRAKLSIQASSNFIMMDTDMMDTETETNSTSGNFTSSSADFST